jgi:hypothetical protein
MRTPVRRRTFGWVATVAATSALLGLAPAADAAPRPGGADFTCRASAIRVALAGQTLLEPVIANAPDAPCADGTAAIISPTDIGPVRLNAANADTAIDPNDLAAAPAANGDNGRAVSTVTNPVVDLSGIRLTADVLGATASATCQSGQTVLAGNSVVANIVLTVGGTAVPITLPAGNEPFTLDLPGGLGTLLLNQRTTTNGRLTQRALELRLPANSALANVVIGEATAGATGNPCAAAATTPPTGTPQCSDGQDNDGDGRSDAQDPGCLSGPGGAFNPQDDDEGNPTFVAAAQGVAECSDTRDNDGDGRSDAQDPGCLSGPGGAFNPTDDDERDAGNTAQCFDGVDNDGDGRTDFGSDRGCSSRTDRTERTPGGTARITSTPSRIASAGASGACVRSSFSARVTGRSIETVVFSLDGRRVRTDRSSPFAARISTTRAGTHRVSARVTFTSDSGTRARTVAFSYRRCTAAVRGPRFTG